MSGDPLLWLTHRSPSSEGAAYLVVLSGHGLTTSPGFALAHRHGWGLVDGPWVSSPDHLRAAGLPSALWALVPVTCRIDRASGPGPPAPPWFEAQKCPMRFDPASPRFACDHRSAALRVAYLDEIIATVRRLTDGHLRQRTLEHLEHAGIWHLVDQRAMPASGEPPDVPGSWLEQTRRALHRANAPVVAPFLQAAEISWVITANPMVPPDPQDITMTKGPSKIWRRG